MKKLRCQDCGRVVEVEEDWDTDATCNECSGCFEEYKSKEDVWKKEKVEEEIVEEKTRECEQCFKYKKEKEVIYFDGVDVHICKSCLDKLYPRETKVKVKEVVKFIENKNFETKTNFNPEAETKFN